MSRRESRLAELRYEYTLQCCGHTYTTPGLPNAKAMYLCRHCEKEMKPKVRQVRSLEACELIVRFEKRFDEPCVECGAKHGHHVVKHADTFFLHCGQCGEELRELELKELQ